MDKHEKKQAHQAENKGIKKFLEHVLEGTIFASRWLQAPLYLGLIVAGILYAYKFGVELIHLASTVESVTEEIFMLGVLTLVDITLVANLLTMIVIGGYATFVSHFDNQHEDRPDWLDDMDPGTLKIKVAAALVGVSSVHLLKSFINISHMEMAQVSMQIAIHFTFLFSALFLAYTEKLTHEKHKGGH